MDLYLTFPLSLAYEPILANIILESKVPISFISIKIHSEGGEGIVSVPDDKVDIITKMLKEKGLQVLSKRHVVIDNNLCIECGLCVSLCYVNALTIDPETLAFVYVEDRCVYCKLCVDACPRDAIKTSM